MALTTDRPVQADNPLPIKQMQANSKVREAFETFVPGTTREQRWNLVSQAAGDIVQIDGNAGSASYLVISKDPFGLDTETVIESNETFVMPFRVGLGLSMSQRGAGQEASVQAVSTDAALGSYTPRAIASVSQATTTLTVNTTLAHGLMPGDRISIYGVSDSRMNYAQLVVASVPSATQFTATAGPNGTIASVTAGPFTSGFVTRRIAFSYSRDGMSLVFEQTSVTQGSVFVRSESGDAFPSGSIIGNHSITLATTASVAAITAAGTYAFNPTSQYELVIQPDMALVLDNAVDSLTAQFSTRRKLTQVVPNPGKVYKLRFRFANMPALSTPVGKVVSSTKAGSTTATVVTDVPHGLTTGDQVVIYGNRDQTNFANLTTATAVASVVNSTTFTVAYGASATATTYGGYVARVNGGQAVPGIVSQAVQRASRTSNVVSLVGNATWTGVVIGDYVNLHGVRVDTTGADLGLDGTYRVRDIQTTTLVLEPIGSAPTGADVGSTNCGGTVIKRTDLRIHFVRVSEETFLAGRGDLAAAQTVQIGATVNVAGSTAIDSGFPNPVGVGLRAANANPAAMSANADLVGPLSTMIGAQVVKPFSIPEADWTYPAASGGIVNTTDVPVKAAAAAGIRNYLTCLQYQNISAVASEIVVKDGSTVIWRGMAPASMAVPAAINFDTPLRSTAATALNVALITTATQTYVNAQGYIAP